MNSSYFLLVDRKTARSPLDHAHVHSELESAGLPLRVKLEAVSVFVTASTPVILLPGGGVILGELYSNDGRSVRDDRRLAQLPAHQPVSRHILDNYWGDYVLLQCGKGDHARISVMRSPSHACALQCLYSLHEGRGFVTSDITLATRTGLHRPRVDFDYLAHRLVYPELKTSRTGQSGIAELLPGSTIHLRDGDLSMSQDWSPWNFVGRQARYADISEAAPMIRRAIERVVRTWAELDQSVLLELSGGLDSSIVGACLKESSAKVSCNTLTAPVPGADEQDYARPVSDMLHAELSVYELAFDDAPLEFPLSEKLVTPVVGPLQYAVNDIMEQAADRTGANSYFSGAGGDTVFCYLTNATPAVDAFREAGFRAGVETIGDLSMFHQCTYWKACHLTLRRLFEANRRQYGFDHSFLPAGMPLPQPEPPPWSSPPRALPGDRQRMFELGATQFFHDSCPRGLARPMRMPLLSQPVMEACLRAPSWMWFSGGQNRSVARRAFSDVLPSRILNRKSKGTFTAYLGALYRRRISQMIHFLVEGELQSRGLVDADILRQFTSRELPRNGDAVMRIFQLCTLENWLRHQS